MFETKTEIENFIKEKFSKITDGSNILDYLRYSFRYESDIYYEGMDDGFCPEEELAEMVGASWCESGASKIVFSWDDIPEIVVKVPFLGNGIFNADDHLLYSFDDFYAAPGTDSSDYCNAEAEIYAEAAVRELDNFFCSTEFICELYGIKFYASTKAVSYYEGPRLDISDNSRKKAQDTDSRELHLTDEFLSILYEQNEEEDVKRLIDFLCDMDANDFHFGNVGYVDGHFKFLDYSGFNE